MFNKKCGLFIVKIKKFLEKRDLNLADTQDNKKKIK